MTNIQPAYLVMVTSDNHNKFYRMVPNEDGSFQVEYGRISSRPQKKRYPLSLWEQKYREKISKGYVDQSELYQCVVKNTSQYATIQNESVRYLVDTLMKWSNEMIRRSYQIISKDVTESMIQKAQTQIDSLSFITSIYEFNSKLLELFTIIPRKMEVVSNYLANSSDDFSSILDREQKTLDVMATQVHQNTSVDLNSTDSHAEAKTILDIMGLEITPCSKEEEAAIRNHLHPNTKAFFNCAWRVVNKKTEAAFIQYVKDRQIQNCKFYFHGSINTNYWNILVEGLKIRKHSVHGSMFGRGLYFAPNSEKSTRYTSLKGSTYAHGNCSKTMLAVFNVAQGDSLDIFSCAQITEESLQKIGKHSVYAHKGVSLRNDEVVVYNESAATIHYLIELKEK